jgi:prophage tail gpP-like protein
MPADVITLEAEENPYWGGGVLDNLTSVEIVMDVGSPSEAHFEVGDDGSFAAIARALGPGQRYTVRVNRRALVSGRIEAHDVPVDARAGASVRFTIRSWLADAMVTGAKPTANYKGTLRDFLVELYAPLGIGEDRFQFRASVARDLRTGKRADGPDPSIRIASLKPEQARVQVGESIFQAAERHLQRFGLMQWDGPDNTIVIGYPNQGQSPIYNLRMYRDPARSGANNILSSTRTRDWSQVPSAVVVHGGRRQGVRPMAIAVNPELTERGIVRPIVLMEDAIKNDEAAANVAHKELAARVRDMDQMQIEVDGLSYLEEQNGYRVPWCVDTIASVTSDVAGGDLGGYYIARVALRRDADRGDQAFLSLIRQGLWQLFPDAYEGRLSS